MRASDIFARFGGEEFAAIVPAATREDLERIAQRMMSAVAELRVDSGAGSFVTVSIGGTLLSAPESVDVQRGLRVADENLYSAKLAGRNRVVLA
jgi:diguanylate cyclase (GGDEF)-like protein